MTQRMKDLAEQIVGLQAELDREIERRRRALGWRLTSQIGEFEFGIASEHRRLRLGMGKFLSRSSLFTLLSAPVIYSLILPLALADAWVSIYQAVCFRAYGIVRVRRTDYLAFDRNRLGYLNLVERLNCAYCAYANGVIAYAREVASRTEQYWCPIKHAVRQSDPHRRYWEFLDYGDAEGYRQRLKMFRDRLRTEPTDAAAP
ncbi:hypothetical protein [Caulobacter sp. 1776]|uniref:hypothetical protein n=1 Tax=Caulobacter sp. 1776 TaxID=3156420 RepID=UPI003398267A